MIINKKPKTNNQTKNKNKKTPQQQTNKQTKQVNLLLMDLAVPADHRVKIKENEKRDKYLDFNREIKTVEHESNVNTDWRAWNAPSN